MKNKIHIIILFLFFCQILPAQDFAGTLVVNTQPLNQPSDQIIKEAGADDIAEGFILLDAATLSYSTTEQNIFNAAVSNCSGNNYRYGVYMHAINLPAGMTIEARLNEPGSADLSGDPVGGVLATLLQGIFGARGAYPRGGAGEWFEIPTNGNNAILIYEFVGCRQGMTLDFRVKATSRLGGGTAANANLQLVYTVRGKSLI